MHICVLTDLWTGVIQPANSAYICIRIGCSTSATKAHLSPYACVQHTSSGTTIINDHPSSTKPSIGTAFYGSLYIWWTFSSAPYNTAATTWLKPSSCYYIYQSMIRQPIEAIPLLPCPCNNPAAYC